MTKSMTYLWLKNLRLAGKVQQAQGRRFFKSLLNPAPAVNQTGNAKKLKAVKTIRPSALRQTKGSLASIAKSLKPRRKPTAIPTRTGASRLPELAGTWRKSFFSLPPVGLVPARRMTYWLYLPAGQPLVPRPLVVMLHGCKQTATDFAAATRMNQLAERKGFAVLYPQQSAAADVNRCWHWYRRATQQGHGDIELVAGMVDQVATQQQLDLTRICVAGLSAGAGLATILALRHPYAFAAVGLHSSPVYGTSDSPMSGFQAMQQGASVGHRDAMREFTNSPGDFPGMPVMLIQGKSDPVVRRVNLDHLVAQFLMVNAPFIANAKPVIRYHPGRPSGRSPRHTYKTETYRSGRKSMLVKCEIDSLGHAWSGGEGSLDYTAAEGPDAALLLWTFFSRQQRL